MFDMSKCKVGDKLVNRKGEVVVLVNVYVCPTPYEYVVKPNASQYSYTVTTKGEYIIGSHRENDIVSFYEEEKTMLERDKEYDIKLTGEDLFLCYLLLGKTFGDIGNSTFGKLYSFLPEKVTEAALNFDMQSIDLPCTDSVLDKAFPKKETEKEKNLREMQEQYEALGESIKKAIQVCGKLKRFVEDI